MEEHIAGIKQNLKVMHHRFKSYGTKHRIHKEFEVEDHVFLRVRPRKISLKLGNCTKFSPRYCGHLRIP